DNEAEALVLENNWIKTKKPRFNIRLRDDKTYPYLKLTMRHDYPRIAFTRRIRNDGAAYFGPYLPGGLARRAIKLVQKLFQVRTCRIEIDGSLARPCLYYDMKRCLGPCVDGLTTHATYAAAVEQAKLFLAGRNDELLRDLRRQMQQASENLEFEEAARLRDLMQEVEEIGRRRKMASVRGEDVDVYGVHVGKGGNAAVTTLVMRGGQIMDRRELFWERQGELTAGALLSAVLPQIYDRTTFIPKEVHLPEPIEGEDALVEWLSQRKEERVYLRMPSRGVKADRVKLAMRNAELAFKRRFRADGRIVGAARLAEQLDLPEPPSRIEGFDISTFHGSDTVASMVVWEAGRMRKGDYRSFNIEGIQLPDDFGAMKQAVGRRYRRVLEEIGQMPDLILIDGGRGQLNAALAALADLGVEETPIVGLAKREEELYLPDRPQPLRLERDDPALQLLITVRDESHRFAVGRHRRRRSTRTVRSGLDGLRGIGPARRKRLVKAFGSFAGVRAASLDDLRSVLGDNLARDVHAQLHADDDAPATAETPGAETAAVGGLAGDANPE
ncbi:MAG: excinuclease ABC subunit UvrC, partial [Acidobacteriota bacterium]